MSRENKRLLICDLDGTLIPGDETEQHREAQRMFSDEIAQGGELLLVYATGRDLRLALRGIAEYELPTPHQLICDVGGSVFSRRAGVWTLDPEYRGELSAEWPMEIRQRLLSLLAVKKELVLQESSRQGEFKLSYYVEDVSLLNCVVDSVKEELSTNAIPAHVIASVSKEREVGLLDVMPPGVSKLRAISWMVMKKSICSDAVVYAGDSGNDIEVFLSGFKSIVVSNTPQSVKEEIKQSSLKRPEINCYFAKASCSAGVLEGCKHYGVFAA